MLWVFLASLMVCTSLLPSTQFVLDVFETPKQEEECCKDMFYASSKYLNSDEQNINSAKQILRIIDSTQDHALDLLANKPSELYKLILIAGLICVLYYDCLFISMNVQAMEAPMQQALYNQRYLRA